MNKSFLATCRIGAAALALVTGISLAQAAQVYVNIAPPAPQVEVVPPPPPGQPMEWRPGFWRWNGNQYVWVRGRYVHPPRMGAHWVPGHWAQGPRGWVWVRGHWG
ncbi:MAG: hypothetical protein ABSG66_00595 [Stellaceae bacterium]|jgi:hypothetical protein